MAFSQHIQRIQRILYLEAVVNKLLYTAAEGLWGEARISRFYTDKVCNHSKMKLILVKIGVYNYRQNESSKFENSICMCMCRKAFKNPITVFCCHTFLCLSTNDTLKYCFSPATLQGHQVKGRGKTQLASMVALPY